MGVARYIYFDPDIWQCEHCKSTSVLLILEDLYANTVSASAVSAKVAMGEQQILATCKECGKWAYDKGYPDKLLDKLNKQDDIDEKLLSTEQCIAILSRQILGTTS